MIEGEEAVALPRRRKVGKKIKIEGFMIGDGEWCGEMHAMAVGIYRVWKINFLFIIFYIW